MSRLEQSVEKVLWGSRLVVLAAVAGSLVASLVLFYVTTADTVLLVGKMLPYARPDLAAEAREALHDTALQKSVKIVDGYLLATVLLIFALGLYELVVGKIRAAQDGRGPEGVLVIRSLDDLKNRLAKVILMILVVTFFERVNAVRTATAMDLLLFAGGIALVGLALYLAHAAEGGRRPPGQAPAGARAAQQD
jgi:uncharacterized membrane protein YqhA